MTGRFLLPHQMLDFLEATSKSPVELARTHLVQIGLSFLPLFAEEGKLQTRGGNRPRGRRERVPTGGAGIT